jgi:shikimate kinase
MLVLKPHIFLVGFMGCGKSTAGKLIASALKRPFIDLDHNIEQIVGTSIAEIVRLRGEPFFRTVETQCLQQSIYNNPAIIALGGGAFTIEFNRTLIARAGVSVWMNAPFDLCWGRIQQDEKIRPLATDYDRALQRYDGRISIYELADVHISASAEDSPEHLSQQIIEQLKARDSM